MTTFTAELTGSAVTLTLAGLTAGGVVTVDRQPDGGVVRGSPVLLGTGAGTVFTDLEYRYGNALTYTATVRDEVTGATLESLQTSAGPIVLPSDGVMVSDPMQGRQVLVTALDEYGSRSEFRGFRFDLSGSTMPLYLTEDHGGWVWEVDYLTATLTDRAVLDVLLRGSDPVLLRPAQGCDLRGGWVVPERVEVRRWSRPASDTRRAWSVTFGETSPPDTSVEPTFITLATLHEWEPATLQDIADRVPTTLLDLTLTVTREAALSA